MRKLITIAFIATLLISAPAVEARENNFVKKVLKGHLGQFKFGLGTVLAFASFSGLLIGPGITVAGPATGICFRSACPWLGLVVGPAITAASFPIGHLGFKLIKSGLRNMANYDEN